MRRKHGKEHWGAEGCKGEILALVLPLSCCVNVSKLLSFSGTLLLCLQK